MKLTKRKAFNFLRSYYDILNKLKTDKDKLDFLESLLDKQFLDKDPNELSFVVDLAYEGVRHQIEQSVKGYKTKTKDTMQGGTQGAMQGGCLQEEEKEEEKEEKKNNILIEKSFNLKNEILSSGIWIETQCKTHKSLELENFKDTFELFWAQNYAGHILENTAKQQNDIKRHFSNTIKKLNNEPTNKKSYVEQLTDKI